ncbi:MAG: hypothetical protein H8D26_00065 [Methanomicrobia archaeon]|nr:hypothetical protein [Methanomicrobia archaeon]
MRFENIQNEGALKKFFTSRGFEMQEYGGRENNITLLLTICSFADGVMG